MFEGDLFRLAWTLLKISQPFYFDIPFILFSIIPHFCVLCLGNVTGTSTILSVYDFSSLEAGKANTRRRQQVPLCRGGNCESTIGWNGNLFFTNGTTEHISLLKTPYFFLWHIYSHSHICLHRFHYIRSSRVITPYSPFLKFFSTAAFEAMLRSSNWFVRRSISAKASELPTGCSCGSSDKGHKNQKKEHKCSHTDHEYERRTSKTALLLHNDGVSQESPGASLCLNTWYSLSETQRVHSAAYSIAKV